MNAYVKRHQFICYMLDNSKSFFRKHLPIYEKSVEKYLYDHLNKSISLNACEIFEYIQKNIKNLTDDPNEEGKVGRPRNNIIGKYIASIILNNPEGWTAIALFPTDDEKMDYNEFVLNDSLEKIKKAERSTEL